MQRTSKADPPLLPDWAFVVQFREGTEMQQGRMEGRAEHIVSGQAARFHSLDELVAFLARILATVHVRPPDV